MKFTVNVDCTPEEARTFLGLPEIKPMQDEMLREIQEKMRAAVGALGPEEAMRMWLPAGTQAVEQMQKMLAQFYGMNRE